MQHAFPLMHNIASEIEAQQEKKERNCWHGYCPKCQILFSRFNAYMRIPRSSIFVERSIVEADNEYAACKSASERKTKKKKRKCGIREKKKKVDLASREIYRR